MDKFELRPGQGFVHFEHAAPQAQTPAQQKRGDDIKYTGVWQGHVRFTDDIGRLQVRMLTDPVKREYRVQLVQFDSWDVLASFKLPPCGDVGYTDAKIKLGGKEFTFRLIRDNERGFMRVNLPEIARAASARAMMP